jgi:hypothetical protein
MINLSQYYKWIYFIFRTKAIPSNFNKWFYLILCSDPFFHFWKTSSWHFYLTLQFYYYLNLWLLILSIHFSPRLIHCAWNNSTPHSFEMSVSFTGTFNLLSYWYFITLHLHTCICILLKIFFLMIYIHLSSSMSLISEAIFPIHSSTSFRSLNYNYLFIWQLRSVNCFY